MKTSHILLAVITIITLTGMVATDVLLKQQYDKLDWRDPYQSFDHRALPLAKNLVIEAAPTSEIIVEPSRDTAQALLLPSMANSYHTRKQGDTLFVSFLMNYDGQSRDPHDDEQYQLPAGLVLRMPDLQSVRIKNGRLTVRQFTPDRLAIVLQNSRLITRKLSTSDICQLTAEQNSVAVLYAGHFQSLQATVQDSSGIQLNDSDIDNFTKRVSDKAEFQLRGKALSWLK